MLFKLVLPTDENKFDPHSENETLVPFKAFLNNFRPSPDHFYMGVPSPPPPPREKGKDTSESDPG